MTEPATAPQPQETRSRAGCWIAFAFLAVLILIGGALLVFGLFATFSGFATEPVRVASGSVLELDLSAFLPEGPPAVDLGPWFTAQRTSHWELLRGLKAAAEDDDIAAVRLWVHNASFGWASAEEVIAHLDRIREAGKPVHVLLQADTIGDLDYFLATAGDRVWATPEAAATINGLAVEAQFLRGSLEKLKIEPEVIMYKEYKSAGETFANYEMSPYMREALEALLATTADRFAERVTTARGISRQELDDFLAEGMAPVPDLLARGLIDDIGYRDQVEEALREQLDLDEYRGVTFAEYLRSLGRPSARGDRVAVVFGEGQIVAEPVDAPLPFFDQGLLSGPIVARNIRRAAEDPQVKAIVFRVSSPGGSAVGSDLVRREIRRAREKGIPVVVSMSDVAGSGGYWVAMDADEIVAHPTTVTGSIGVVFTRFDVSGFLDWIGVGVSEIKTAPNADLFGIGPLDEDDYEAIRSWMDRAYADFVQGVADGRDLQLEEAQEIAKGRIWSGDDALERQLVDHLGGFELAIERARALAELPEDAPLVVYPKARTLWQQLMEDNGLATTRTLPLDPSAMTDVARRLGRPQVQALMPSVHVH